MTKENRLIWEQLFSQGKQFFEEEKYEAAINVLEDAEKLEPDDKITYFIYLSRKAIEPEYNNAKIEKKIFKEKDVNFETFKSSVYTIFDYLMPKRIFGFNTFGKGCYVAIVLIILFNIITTGLIFLLDRKYFIQYWVAPLSLSVLEFMILGTIPKQKNYYLQNYYRINKQIADMKIQRYFYWFTGHIFKMFGYVRIENEVGDKTKPKIDIKKYLYCFINYVLRIFGYVKKEKKDKGKTKLKMDFKSEKLFITLIIAFIVIWSGAAYFMQGMDRLHPVVSILQFLQVTIFWTVIAFMLRILITTAKFVYDFGRQSLKPPITESNNQGFSVFLGGYMKLLGLFILFWFFFWLYFSVVCVSPHNTDIIGVALAWILVCLWTIRLPVNLTFVSKQAFNAALFKYQLSVLKAYNSFSNNPNYETKEKLNDLHASEKVLNKMTIKTLKPRHVLAIILANIWVFACGAAYILLIVFKVSIADAINNLLRMIGVSI